MFKFFKKRFVLISLIVLILLVAVIGLVFINLGGIIRSNKDAILAKVEESIGRKVTIEKMDVSVWSGVGVQLTNITVAEDPDFSEDHFITANEADLYFKLLPLLGKRIEISHLTVHKPSIQIIKNKDGQYNFTSLLASNLNSTTETSATTSETSAISLTLSNFELLDGQIKAIQQSDNQTLQLTDVDMNVRNFSLDKAFPLKVSLAWDSENPNLTLDGDIGPLAAEDQPISINTNITFDQLALSNVQSIIPAAVSLPKDLELNGSISGKTLVKGSLDHLQINADLDATESGIKMNPQFNKPKSTPFKVKFDSSLVDKNLSVQNVNVTLDTINLKGEGKIVLQETPSFDLDVKTDGLDISKISTYVPQLQSTLPRDISVDGAITGNALIKGTLADLQIQTKLDGSNAVIEMKDLLAKAKNVPFHLDLNAHKAGNAIDIKKSVIRLDNAEVQAIGRMSMGKTSSYDLDVNTNDIKLSNLSSHVSLLEEYKPTGDVHFNGHIDYDGKTPLIEGTLSLKNVEVTVQKIPNPISDLNGEITFESKTAITENLGLKLGQSTIKADAQTSSLSPIALSYTILSPQLHATDIFAAPEAMKKDIMQNVEISGNVEMKETLNSKGTIKSQNGIFYGLPYSDLTGTYQFEDQILTSNDLTLQTMKGTVVADLTYNMQETPYAFEINAETQQVDVMELVRTRFSYIPPLLEGRLNTNLNLSGSGTDWESIKPSLKGKGSVQILEGLLLDTNIVNKVLDGMTGMPGVSNFISANFGQDYPQIFNSKHTAFDQLKFDALIQDGKVDIQNLLIDATEWLVGGTGYVDFKQNLYTDSTLKLSKGFSDYLIGKVNIFKYLTNQEGSMIIPFLLKGPLSSPTPQPKVDLVQSLLQKAVMGKIGEQLQDKGAPNMLQGALDLLKQPSQKKVESGTKTEEKESPKSPLDIFNTIKKGIDKKNE